MKPTAAGALGAFALIVVLLAACGTHVVPDPIRDRLVGQTDCGTPPKTTPAILHVKEPVTLEYEDDKPIQVAAIKGTDLSVEGRVGPCFFEVETSEDQLSLYQAEYAKESVIGYVRWDARTMDAVMVTATPASRQSPAA
jgi:hypothetical protein